MYTVVSKLTINVILQEFCYSVCIVCNYHIYTVTPHSTVYLPTLSQSELFRELGFPSL